MLTVKQQDTSEKDLAAASLWSDRTTWNIVERRPKRFRRLRRREEDPKYLADLSEKSENMILLFDIFFSFRMLFLNGEAKSVVSWVHFVDGTGPGEVNEQLQQLERQQQDGVQPNDVDAFVSSFSLLVLKVVPHFFCTTKGTWCSEMFWVQVPCSTKTPCHHQWGTITVRKKISFFFSGMSPSFFQYHCISSVLLLQKRCHISRCSFSWLVAMAPVNHDPTSAGSCNLQPVVRIRRAANNGDDSAEHGFFGF